MIKVTLCSPVEGIGGIVSATDTIVGWHRANPDCGVSLSVIPMDNPRHPALRPGVSDALLPRLVRGARAYLPFLPELYRRLREDPPDLLHINTSGGAAHLRDIAMLSLARRLSIPTVLHLHHGRGSSGMTGLERHLLPAAVALASGVAAFDPPTLDAALPGSHPPVAAILPNPAPLSLSTLQNAGSAESDGPLPAVPDCRRILYAGHVCRAKGTDLLIEAMRSLPQITLHILGPDIDRLCSQGKGTLPPNVRYDGPVARREVIRALRGSALILPSLSEAFPVSILEAMAAGAPVIAAAVGAVPSILGLERPPAPHTLPMEAPCGILIAPGSARQIEEGIRRLLSDPAATRRRADAARRRVETLYSPDAVIPHLHSLWRRTLASCPRFR